MYEPIKLKLENSCITFEIIDKYPWEYQALLENIADYLEDGLFWIGVENGVLFNDITPIDSDKKIHHFRRYTVCDELQYVAICWLNCLKNFRRYTVCDELQYVAICWQNCLKNFRRYTVCDELQYVAVCCNMLAKLFEEF